MNLPDKKIWTKSQSFSIFLAFSEYLSFTDLTRKHVVSLNELLDKKIWNTEMEMMLPKGTMQWKSKEARCQSS